MTDIQHPSAMYFNVLKLLKRKLGFFFAYLFSHNNTLLHVAVVDDLLLTSPYFSIDAIISYATKFRCNSCC